MKPKVLFTDGEGPIVFKDLAADMTEKIVPGLFPVISLYDDYLAEIEREGYQAGDTLALVVPNFLAHGVTDADIAEEARDAKVCLGVEKYISGLKRDGWQVRIISTAYSQLWQLVGKHISIPMDDIACTNLDLKGLSSRFSSGEFNDAVRSAEQNILSLVPLGKKALEEVDKGRTVVEVFEEPRFEPLKEGLDGFFWKQLPDMRFKVLEETRVIGGKRKIEAAQRFAQDLGVNLGDIAYVGDSITDDAMHARLSREGGLPIAINGSVYALRNARVAVATEDMRELRPILDAWQQNGFRGVQKRVQKSNFSFTEGKKGTLRHEKTGAHYNIVDFSDVSKREELIAVHKDYRTRVRGAATARLG